MRFLALLSLLISWVFTYYVFAGDFDFFTMAYKGPPPPNFGQLPEASEGPPAVQPKGLFVESLEDFPISSSDAIFETSHGKKPWIIFSCDMTSWNHSTVIVKDAVLFSIGNFRDGSPLLAFDLKGRSLLKSLTQFYFKLGKTEHIDSRFVFDFLKKVATTEDGKDVLHRFRVQGNLKPLDSDRNKYSFYLTSIDMDAEEKKEAEKKRLPLLCDYEIL